MRLASYSFVWYNAQPIEGKVRWNGNERVRWKTNGFLASRFILPLNAPPPEVPTDDCSYCEYNACEATAYD